MGRRTWLLSNPLFRCTLLICLAWSVPGARLWAAPAPLTTAAQVRSLPKGDAGRELPVHLRGLYMGGADPQGISFVMHDETDGIYVQAPAESLIGVGRGDLVEIYGVTNPGGFAPYVVAQTLKKLGRGTIPEPEPVSLDELNASHMDARWVEVFGIVRSVQPKVATDSAPPPPGTRYASPTSGREIPDKEKTKLKLAYGGASVMVEVNETLDPQRYVDAEVRMRGLCYNLHNGSRQFVKPFLQVPRGVEITIVRPPPPDAFLSEPRSISSLLQFERRTDRFGHRVHIRGTVVHYRPGETLWVREGPRSLRVETQQEEAGGLRPGDEVDVLGFQTLGVYSPILEDAVFTKRAAGPAPAPVALRDVSGALQNDANLVTLRARLSEVRHFHDLVELTLQWEDTAVRASMHLGAGESISDDWLPGSEVQLTGICEVVADEPEPLGGLWVPKGFEILLRASQDLTIVQPPPWWNVERIVWLLSTFLVLAVAALGAIMYASQRRLKDQERRREMAETEFRAILSERNRVAREIHDTLSQSLGAISMHLELARTHADELSVPVRSCLGTAHKLARGALAEARESIWNMRSQVLEKGDLGDALDKILKQNLEGTDIKGSMLVEGTRHRLAPFVENNLLRIGQEAITNACKHGQPQTVAVVLRFEHRLARLTVQDDGVGFLEAQLPQTERRSFGLVGIRERTELLRGRVEIDSAPGTGTRVLVEVPV